MFKLHFLTTSLSQGPKSYYVLNVLLKVCTYQNLITYTVKIILTQCTEYECMLHTYLANAFQHCVSTRGLRICITMKYICQENLLPLGKSS